MKRPLLHIEELPGEKLRLMINDRPSCARMIRAAMQDRPDIAAIFVSATVGYIHDNNLNFEDFNKLKK